MRVAIDVIGGKAYHVSVLSHDPRFDLVRALTVAMGEFKKVQVSSSD